MTYSKVGWAEDTARSLDNFNNMETQYDEAVTYADGRYHSLNQQSRNARHRTIGSMTEHLYAEIRSAAPASPATGRVYYNSTDSRFYGYNGTVWLHLAGKMTLFDGTATDTMIPKNSWVASVHSDPGQFANDEGDYLHFKVAGSSSAYAVFEIAESMYPNYTGVFVDWELINNINNTGTTGAYIIMPGIRLMRYAHARQQEFIPVSHFRKFTSPAGPGIVEEDGTVEFKIWKLEIVL